LLLLFRSETPLLPSLVGVAARHTSSIQDSVELGRPDPEPRGEVANYLASQVSLYDPVVTGLPHSPPNFPLHCNSLEGNVVVGVAGGDWSLLEVAGVRRNVALRGEATAVLALVA
jgi:hypothetical protein